MKVTIDKNSGFCWGVVRTVDIAEEVMKDSPELYSLGPIIHNPMEINRLKEKGLETITHSDFEQLSGKKVLIRAHGEPPSTYALARKNNIELIDATCPVVTKVQERIRKFCDKGYQIVIFGKKDHAEVIGLVGHTNNEAIVIKSVEETSKVDLTRKTVLFSQTTMDKPTFYEIARVLKEKVRGEFEVGTFEESAIDFHAKDTICGQVSGRDKKLREFASQNDVMIFVAGRNSSNGKVLYDICKEANPDTFFIEQESELKHEWFEGKKSAGISGATSTPHWLMEKVKTAVEMIASPMHAEHTV
ncbi:MAG: 4-hydroxy-3-methylbut-2-enyl diphosphate reductase [Bacteroidetes bacterium]|nr:4-hydroxy-3-methylbut-2-enyl diphosphate reductase [Bacteroidota bacterium]MCW5896131.1 4-hydroxy-3-methylbut-2-enyl diphosphate reductase [Bacteroidota bacterium]